MAFSIFLNAIGTPHHTPYLYTSITPFLPSRYNVIYPPPPTPPSTADAMGSKLRISAPTSVTRLRRRLSNSTTRLRKRQLCRRRSALIDGGAAGSSVSGKLAALRDLIPSESSDMKPDQLFRETADYIVLLKSQVLLLQKLVDFYGSQPQGIGDGDAV